MHGKEKTIDSKLVAKWNSNNRSIRKSDSCSFYRNLKSELQSSSSRWIIDTLLTHWGRVTHICVGNLTTIVSDNALSPDRRQTIIWTNVGILLIGPLGTNLSEILIENSYIFIQENSDVHICRNFRLYIDHQISISTATIVPGWTHYLEIQFNFIGSF